jgi:hypothetical protein
LYSRLTGPGDRSRELRKISNPPGFDPRIIQLEAIRYNDYVVLAPFKVLNFIIYTYLYSGYIKSSDTEQIALKIVLFFKCMKFALHLAFTTEYNMSDIMILQGVYK